IREIKPATVEVEPGIILDDLNQQLRSRQCQFPVDPVSGKLCTIGGMIATNAAGPHGVKYGSTKDHIESMTVVLANGDFATFSKDFTSNSSHVGSATTYIHSQLESLLFQNKEEILQRFPRVAKNSCGYNLIDAVKTGTLDILKLLTGSEGTLAVIVRATLRLFPIPRARVGAVAYFRDYSSTVEATLRGLETKPSAIEIMDRTYFLLGQGFSTATDALINPEASTMLYFEYEGESTEAIEPSVSKLADALKLCHAMRFSILNSTAELNKLLDLREAVSKKINLDETFGKSSFIEDVAVPIHNMPAYIVGLSRILQQYGIEFSIYGHAGSGNIHCGTFLDMNDPKQYSAIDRVAGEVNDLAISLGGTLSGEHGDGFIRTPFLERLYGPEVYQIFNQVKHIFDPANILNPGKIIGPQNTSILHDISFA
ncbi:MAG TPA: FAD-binding oxidoreductase, partial [Bacteroidota bacterium]|nr:FAD-binding oxidoreductase [Bacteroidota bacterium]